MQPSSLQSHLIPKNTFQYNMPQSVPPQILSQNKMIEKQLLKIPGQGSFSYAQETVASDFDANYNLFLINVKGNQRFRVSQGVYSTKSFLNTLFQFQQVTVVPGQQPAGFYRRIDYLPLKRCTITLDNKQIYNSENNSIDMISNYRQKYNNQRKLQMNSSDIQYEDKNYNAQQKNYQFVNQILSENYENVVQDLYLQDTLEKVFPNLFQQEYFIVQNQMIIDLEFFCQDLQQFLQTNMAIASTNQGVFSFSSAQIDNSLFPFKFTANVNNQNPNVKYVFEIAVIPVSCTLNLIQYTKYPQEIIQPLENIYNIINSQYFSQQQCIIPTQIKKLVLKHVSTIDETDRNYQYNFLDYLAAIPYGLQFNNRVIIDAKEQNELYGQCNALCDEEKADKNNDIIIFNNFQQGQQNILNQIKQDYYIYAIYVQPFFI